MLVTGGQCRAHHESSPPAIGPAENPHLEPNAMSGGHVAFCVATAFKVGQHREMSSGTLRRPRFHGGRPDRNFYDIALVT